MRLVLWNIEIATFVLWLILRSLRRLRMLWGACGSGGLLRSNRLGHGLRVVGEVIKVFRGEVRRFGGVGRHSRVSRGMSFQGGVGRLSRVSRGMSFQGGVGRLSSSVSRLGWCLGGRLDWGLVSGLLYLTGGGLVSGLLFLKGGGLVSRLLFLIVIISVGGGLRRIATLNWSLVRRLLLFIVIISVVAVGLWGIGRLGWGLIRRLLLFKVIISVVGAGRLWRVAGLGWCLLLRCSLCLVGRRWVRSSLIGIGSSGWLVIGRAWPVGSRAWLLGSRACLGRGAIGGQLIIVVVIRRRLGRRIAWFAGRVSVRRSGGRIGAPDLIRLGGLGGESEQHNGCSEWLKHFWFYINFFKFCVNKWTDLTENR